MNIRSIAIAGVWSAMVMLFAGPTAAEVVSTSISDALATPDAQAKLDKSIAFYFGDSPHPVVAQSLGSFHFNTKASAFNKTRTQQCERAFLSNLLDIQQKAHELGADAAINIHSYYKNGDRVSSTEIDCDTGFLMVGVSLDGDYVKLAK